MSWRDLILHNLWLKVMSLALATIVWFTFRSGELSFHMPQELAVTSTRDFIRHPVTVMKAAGDLRNFRVEPEEVDISVNGDVAVLKQLSGRDIRAFVDLTTAKNEQGPLKIQILAPPGVNVRLEKAVPPEVRVFRVEP